MSIASSYSSSSSHLGWVNPIGGGGRLGLVWWGQDAQIFMWYFWGVLGTQTWIFGLWRGRQISLGLFGGFGLAWHFGHHDHASFLVS